MLKSVLLATGALLMTGLVNTAIAQGTSAPSDARAYIVSPAHGEVVKGPVKVRFGLSGMGVAPAGVQAPNTGHHHLLINVKDKPALDKALPADDNHRHFGGGQTEVVLDLTPGEYTLQLILGDHDHIPHDPPVISEKIRIRVK